MITQPFLDLANPMGVLLQPKKAPLSIEEQKYEHQQLITIDDLEPMGDDGDIVKDAQGADVMDPDDATKKLTKIRQRYLKTLENIFGVQNVLAKAKKRNADAFVVPKQAMSMAQMQALMISSQQQMAQAMVTLAGMYPCTQKRVFLLYNLFIFVQIVFDVCFD